MTKKQIDIYTGDFYASREPVIIRTLLGSCVAVCLLDPANRIGGMNHILLPGNPDMKRFDFSARYGVNAMDMLINKILVLGGDRRRLVAKVFGGAHVLREMPAKYDTGREISKFVIAFLENEKIKLISHDLGGSDTRRIYFHSDTGDVFLKRIPSMKDPGIFHMELKRLKKIIQKIEVRSDVTIFGSSPDKL